MTDGTPPEQYVIVDCGDPDCGLCPRVWRDGGGHDGEAQAVEVAKAHRGDGETTVLVATVENPNPTPGADGEAGGEHS